MVRSRIRFRQAYKEKRLEVGEAVAARSRAKVWA
jgi:hypothetical protein